MSSLKKLREKFIAFILAFTVPLSGCTKTNNNQEELNEFVPEFSEEETLPILEEEMEQKFNDFLDNVEEIIPDYDFENDYFNQEKIDEILEFAKNKVDCLYEFTSDIDDEIEDLFSKIKDNSLEFYEKNKDLFPSFSNNNEEETIIFETAFKEGLYEVLLGSQNNVKEDICRLSTLRILLTNDIIYQGTFYYDLNTVYINIDEIYDQAKIFDKNQYEYLKDVIKIILNYSRLRDCEHRAKKELNGVSYSKHISTLETAAAESAILYSNGYNADNYINYREVKAESLLFLLALFNEEATLDDYYKAMFDGNLQGIYSFFALKTEEEITSFYKILYAIDTNNYRTDLFYKTWKELGFEAAENIAGYNYRTDIFKFTLKKLANYTYTHPDFSLEDNIRIFEIIKALIVKGAYEIEEVPNIDAFEFKNVYDPIFVQDVVTLEQMYVEFLRSAYHVSILDIRQMSEKAVNYVADLDKTSEYNEETIAKRNELYKRFPVLKGILETNSLRGYNDFLEDNNITTNKTR